MIGTCQDEDIPHALSCHLKALEKSSAPTMADMGICSLRIGYDQMQHLISCARSVMCMQLESGMSHSFLDGEMIPRACA